MSNPDLPKDFMNQKAAWLAVAEELRRREAVSEPDALLLAAWLEGRLDETEAAPVERWIAHDPATASMRLSVLRESLGEASVTVPGALSLRLRAMAPRRGGAAGPTLAPVVRLWRRLPQAAAVAAALSLGLFGAYSGYEMGMKASLAHEQTEAALLRTTLLSDFDLTQEDFFFE